MTRFLSQHRWVYLVGLAVLAWTMVSAGAPVALAQATSWPMYQYNLQRQAANPDPNDRITPDTVSGLDFAWIFPTDGPILAEPIVANGMIFFGSSDGMFYALNATTGALLWQTYLGSAPRRGACDPPQLGLSSSALYYVFPEGPRVIYVAGVDEDRDPNQAQNIYLYALDADTGVEYWRQSVGDPRQGAYAWASPFIANNKLFYGIGSHADAGSVGGAACPLIVGKLFVFDLAGNPAAGRNQRTFVNGPGLVGGGIFATPAVDEATGTIYLTTGNAQTANYSASFDYRTQPESNALVALDWNTLDTKASWQLPGPLNGVYDLSSGPILFTSDGPGPRKLVGVGGRNNSFYAFDADDPHNIAKGPVWVQQIGDRRGKNAKNGEGVLSSAAFINGTLYVGGGDRCFNTARGCATFVPGSVAALDPSSGRVKWRHQTTGRVIGALSGSNKGVLYVPSAMDNATDNQFEVLDARDGSSLFQFSAGDRLWSGAAAAGSMVYVGSYDGGLYALRVNNDLIVPPDPYAPPSGLDAKPGNRSATLTWISRGLPARFTIQRKVHNEGLLWDTVAEAVMTTPYTDPSVSNATIYDYRVIANFNDGGVSGPSKVATVIPSAGVAPVWASMDINTELPGSADIVEDGRIQISAAGGDVFGPQDQFHYVFKPQVYQSNVEITARLTAVTPTSLYTKAGVDIRAASGSASTDPGAPHLAMFYLPLPGTGLESNYRNTDYYGGSSFPSPHVPADLPVWLRVRRRGRQMEAFYSRDGKNWARMGTPVDFGDRLQSGVVVGLTVTAHDESQITQAVFDSITINTDVPPQAPFNVRATTPSMTSVQLDWDGALGASGYYVYRQENRQGDFELVNDAPITGTRFVDPNVAPHTIYFYKVSAVNDNGEEFSNEVYVRVGTANLSGFTSKEIGTAFVGDADIDPGTGVLSVYTAGSDIWGNADSFRYTYKSMCSDDGELSARILYLDSVDEYSKAGIMIRESDSPNARNLSLLWIGTHRFRVQWRTGTGASTDDNHFDIPGELEMYMRIVRTGFIFKAYLSRDGKAWTLVGPPDGIRIGMGTAALQGIAVTSHNNGRGGLARLDNITLGPEGPSDPSDPPLQPGDLSVRSGNRRIALAWGPACNAVRYIVRRGLSADDLQPLPNPVTGTSLVDTGLMLDTTYYYQVVGVNSAGTLGDPSPIGSGQAVNLYDFDDQADIGTNTPGRTLARSATVFEITGSGSDIWNQADGCRFIYKELTGDVTITARVTSMTRTNEWAKAGVMIRETVDAASKHFSLVQAYDHGINMQYRPGTASTSSSADDLRIRDGVIPPPQHWLRIHRRGSTFSAEWSEDGRTYTPIPRTVDIGMSSRVFVGLAVTAHNEGSLNTSVFDNVSITQP